VAGLAKSDVTACARRCAPARRNSLRASVSLDQLPTADGLAYAHGLSGAYGLAMSWMCSNSGSPRRSFRELVDAACPAPMEKRCSMSSLLRGLSR